MQCYETDNMPYNETDHMQCYETDTTTRHTNTILGTHTGLSSSWIHTKTHNTTLGIHTGFSPLWILTKIHDTLLGTYAGFSPHRFSPRLVTWYLAPMLDSLPMDSHQRSQPPTWHPYWILILMDSHQDSQHDIWHPCWILSSWIHTKLIT